MTSRDTPCLLWLVCVYFTTGISSISLQISGGSHRFFIQNFDADYPQVDEQAATHQKTKRYIIQQKESSHLEANPQDRSSDQNDETETSIKLLSELLAKCQQTPVRGSCKDTYVPRIYFADDAHPQSDNNEKDLDQGRNLRDNLIDDEDTLKTNDNTQPLVPNAGIKTTNEDQAEKAENSLAYPTIFVDQTMISDIIKDPSVEDIIFIRKEVRDKDLEANIKNKCENVAKQLHILKKVRAIHEDIRQKNRELGGQNFVNSLAVNGKPESDSQTWITPLNPVDSGSSSSVNGATSGYVINEDSRKIVPVTVIENSGSTERIFPLPGLVSIASEKPLTNFPGLKDIDANSSTFINESRGSTEVSDILDKFNQSTKISVVDDNRSTESSEDAKIFGPNSVQNTRLTRTTLLPENLSAFRSTKQPDIEISMTESSLDISSTLDPDLEQDSGTPSPETVEKINDLDDSSTDATGFTAIVSLISDATERNLDTSDSETLSTLEEGTSTSSPDILTDQDKDYSGADDATVTPLDEYEYSPSTSPDETKFLSWLNSKFTTEDPDMFSDDSTTATSDGDKSELTETTGSENEKSEATLAAEISDLLSTGYTDSSTDETLVPDVKRLAPDYSYSDATTSSDLDNLETSTNDPTVSESYSTSETANSDDAKLLMTEMTDLTDLTTIEPLTSTAEDTVSTEKPTDEKISPLVPLIPPPTQQPEINGAKPFHEEHNIHKETKMTFEEKVNETIISDMPGNNAGVIVSPIRKGLSNDFTSFDQEKPPLSSADQITDSSIVPKPVIKTIPTDQSKPDVVKNPVDQKPADKITLIDSEKFDGVKKPVDPQPGNKINPVVKVKPSDGSKPIAQKPENQAKPTTQKPVVNKVSPSGNQAKPIMTKPSLTSNSNNSEQKQLSGNSSTKLITDANKSLIKFPDLPKIDVNSLENKYTPFNDLRVYINQQNKKQGATSQLSDRDLKDKIDHAFHHAEINVPIDLGSKERPSSQSGAEIFLHGNADDFSKIQTVNGAASSAESYNENSGDVKVRPTSVPKITQKELKSKIELRVPNAIVADGLLNTFFIILLSDNATRSDIENKNTDGSPPAAVEVDDLCVPLYENGTMNDFLSITKLLKGAVYFKNSRAKVPIRIRKGGERKCSSLNAYNIFKEFGESEVIPNTVAKRKVSDEDFRRISKGGTGNGNRNGNGNSANERKFYADTSGFGNNSGNRISKVQENVSGSSDRKPKAPGYSSTSGEQRRENTPGYGNSSAYRKPNAPVKVNTSDNRNSNSQRYGGDGFGDRKQEKLFPQNIPFFRKSDGSEYRLNLDNRNTQEHRDSWTEKRVTQRAAPWDGSDVAVGSSQKKGQKVGGTSPSLREAGGPRDAALDVVNSVKKQDALFEQFLKMKGRINEELDSFIQKPVVIVKSQQNFVNKNNKS